MSQHISNVRPPFDQVLVDIVDYVRDYKITSSLAYETARYCLLDTLGCGLQALDFPACTKLLGPVVPGLTMKNGKVINEEPLLTELHARIRDVRVGPDGAVYAMTDSGGFFIFLGLATVFLT